MTMPPAPDEIEKTGSDAEPTKHSDPTLDDCLFDATLFEEYTAPHLAELPVDDDPDLVAEAERIFRKWGHLFDGGSP